MVHQCISNKKHLLELRLKLILQFLLSDDLLLKSIFCLELVEKEQDFETYSACSVVVFGSLGFFTQQGPNLLDIIHTIQYNTIQYNTIQYNTIQYNTIQYNTIQYNTIVYCITLDDIYMYIMYIMHNINIISHSSWPYMDPNGPSF